MLVSRSTLCLLTGVGVIAAVTMIIADDRTAPKTQPARSATAAGSTADGQLAACLVVDNQGEIAIAQIAAQRSENKEVQAFAQQMIKDHQEMVRNLERFAGSSAAHSAPAEKINGKATTTEPPSVANTRNEGNTQTGANAPVAKAPAAGGRQGGLDFVALKRELGEQCLQSTRTELEKKEGAEFDKCFMFQQVMAHVRAVDTIEVFKRHASPDLQTVLTEGLQTSQTHLQHAKDLAMKVDKSAENTTTAVKAEAK